jgi:hypothetical protein
LEAAGAKYEEWACEGPFMDGEDNGASILLGGVYLLTLGCGGEVTARVDGVFRCTERRGVENPDYCGRCKLFGVTLKRSAKRSEE